jgi:hypothetical protein
VPFLPLLPSTCYLLPPPFVIPIDGPQTIDVTAAANSKEKPDDQ